jgi:hypothetical protein
MEDSEANGSRHSPHLICTLFLHECEFHFDDVSAECATQYVATDGLSCLGLVYMQDMSNAVQFFSVADIRLLIVIMLNYTLMWV